MSSKYQSAIFALLLSLLLSSIQLSNPQVGVAASAFASGTPCQVTVSSTTNLSYQHDATTRTCSFAFTYHASARSITLPQNLFETRITLQGARGGQGGIRGSTAASTNSYVGIYSGLIPSSSESVITIYTGARGANAESTTRNGNVRSGGAAGTNSSGVGSGGAGGSVTGGFESGQNSNGSGGGGGASTVALINGTAIYAGGGGGTGGSGRKHKDGGLVSLAGGTAETTVSTQTNSSSAGARGSGPTSGDNSTSAYTWPGAGGGGGGGYLGGRGGATGTLSTFNGPSSASQGGYPGLNGSDYPLEETSTAYQLVNTSLTTSSADGRVDIEFTYKVSTSASVNFLAENLRYRTVSNISVSTSVAGRVTFLANSVRIPGCRRKVSNNANQFTVVCPYKPSNHSPVAIKVYFDPGPSYFDNTVILQTLHVLRRTNPR